jgi:hypothetical protein
MNAPLPAKAKSKRKGKGKGKTEGGLDKGAFFRLCRMLHAYLSAFAFLALIFFSATGVLLNHSEWFAGYHPAEKAASVSLTPAELAAAKAAKDPGRALAAAVALKTPLKGAYASSDLGDRQALIHLEGPKGSSDLTVDQTTGQVQARVASASFAAIIQDLHRGQNSGAPWRFVIDAGAYLILALSLIGYVLFFSLRFRLRNSLILTGVSLATMVAVAVWLVP